MPLSRRQIYRRRRVVVFGMLAVLLGALIYLPMTAFAPVNAVSAVVQPFETPTLDAPALAFPGYGSSAIGAVSFDGVLATSGSEEPRPIASITKIITSLVVLDAKPLGADDAGPEITFTAKDVGFYADALALNGSVKSVRSGMTLTQRQLLEVTLIPSANNYAMSMANWAFGSETAYLAAARAWLDAHGLQTVTVVDTNGLSPRNTATASDLVALGKIAIHNPVIAAVTSTKATTEPGVGEIKNTNKLLGIDGIDGIKTGTLDEAGACLLFSADVTVGESTVTVVGAVLGAPDHSTLAGHVRTLLKSAAAGFHEVTLVSAGDPLVSYDTIWGDEATGVAAETSTIVVWADTPVAVLVAARPIGLADKGDDVGTATFTIGDRTIDILIDLDQAIEDPGFWWRISHPAELFAVAPG